MFAHSFTLVSYVRLAFTLPKNGLGSVLFRRLAYARGVECQISQNSPSVVHTERAPSLARDVFIAMPLG